MAARRYLAAFTLGVLAIGMALSQIGCFPAQRIWRPGATGVVVDQRTSKPLHGASVCLEGPLGNGKDGMRTELVTGDDGSFVFAPVQHWWLRPIVFGDDIAAPRARLSISCEGYADQQIEVINSQSLGQIKLAQQPIR
ncbi:hypothetical protein BH09PLA1_BH09PLA1_22660 [soil metagenome]